METRKTIVSVHVKAERLYIWRVNYAVWHYDLAPIHFAPLDEVKKELIEEITDYESKSGFEYKNLIDILPDYMISKTDYLRKEVRDALRKGRVRQ